MADPENQAGDSQDVVVTDKELFDHAISDAPAPAPAAAPTTPETAPQEGGGERQRDELGRFVPKPPEVAKTQEPPQPQQPVAAQQPQRPDEHRVPLSELLSEREKRQRLEIEANQMRQAWAQFQAQQVALAQQQQQPPQTIFDAPDQYLAQNVVNPLRQEGQMYMMQIKDGLSREMANNQFGEQHVNAALEDLTKIRQSPQGDFVFRQIMGSGHPYGQLVKWHQMAKAQQAIGSDPHAWLRQQQERWLADPKVQAEVLKRVRETQQSQQRPPNVSLPPSLSSLPSTSGRLEDAGDLSNESLYHFATK